MRPLHPGLDDIQGNEVIGRSGKGYRTRIAFDLNEAMAASSCVSCGECVAACPTGALTNKPIRSIPIRPRAELDAVQTVCPYCGVGCALTYHVDRKRGAIAYAEGRDQPGSQGRLCVMGRYGCAYAASLPQGPVVDGGGRRQAPQRAAPIGGIDAGAITGVARVWGSAPQGSSSGAWEPPSTPPALGCREGSCHQVPSVMFLLVNDLSSDLREVFRTRHNS